MRYLLHIVIILSVFSSQYAVATDIDCLLLKNNKTSSHSDAEMWIHHHVDAYDREHDADSSHHDGATESTHNSMTDDQCCSVSVIFIKSATSWLTQNNFRFVTRFEVVATRAKLVQYAPLLRPPI